MFPGQSLLDVSGDYLLGPKPFQWLIRKVHNGVLQYTEQEQTPHMIKKATLFIYFHVLFYTVEIVGNYYSNLFKHSEEPASFLLRNLSSTLQTISAWDASMIIDSNSKSVQTLLVWLQDVLINGLSFWRSSLYSSVTEDGDSLNL